MWDNWPEMQGKTPLSRDDFAMRFAYDTGYKPSMQGALPLPRVATATGALQQRVLIKMAVGTWKIENFSEFP
jgi:hypothetical protein